MRLLQRGDNGKLCLTQNLADDIPPYAILSHMWGPDFEEVTFRDFEDGTPERKLGYDKIEFCMEQAVRNDIQYCWVDTCCIDRSNSEELQASINSMFRWYRDAARCFVYLSDVSQKGDKSDLSWKPAFQKSRWFTRGWTLQELLAPTSVQFFSRDGMLLGDKGSLEPEIHKITKIPIPALRKAISFNQFDVDERLSWAKMRQTTREEDWAYCLLGIFGVFMPLLYGEGRNNAVHRLRKEINNTPKRQEWLRKLYACPYRDRKDRNPLRVPGTCDWFTSHLLFQNWHQSSAASLLWVSADPGCGKSVLAKYLADEVIPSTNTRTTCYFFFKEDFEDQRSSVTALCSILHQVFDQHPASFSAQILEKLEDKGDKLLTSFGDLWDLLISTAAGHKQREIICILDALDECETLERNQLIKAISKFYMVATPHTPVVKFVLTSRPYLDIRAGLHDLECKMPTIHLSGEKEDEVDKISVEIDMVIRSKVTGMPRLAENERSVLEAELTRVPNRTYLWVHLVFDEIQSAILLSPTKIRSELQKIPRTVEQAYERILSKSRDASLAKKLLHIIVASARPLTLQEMALALAILPTHRSVGDLELAPETRFREDIRELCGLFVVVVDSKIYLLHQTAREFLIHRPSLPPLPSSGSTASRWKFSLHPRESSRILAEICMLRLSLSDWNPQSLQASREWREYIAARTFLGYAAEFWANHFRNSDCENIGRMVKMALSYFNPQLPASLAWLRIYQTLAGGETPMNSTPLAVASYFGLVVVVQHLLEAGADANAEEDDGMKPLHFAAANGHDAVAQRLLRAGADANAGNRLGETPLHLAARCGHDAVAERLLEGGADVNAKSYLNDNRTPLHYAALYGHDAIAQRLLEAGADANSKNALRETPLYWAASYGHVAVARRLLEAGADANAKNGLWETPLHWAASHGHEAVARRLLEAGADANAKKKNGVTPLHWAASWGHDAVVQLLLEAGADANAKHIRSGRTPIQYAVSKGHVTVVQRLQSVLAIYSL